MEPEGEEGATGQVKEYGYQVTPTRLAKTQSVKRPRVIVEETQVLVSGQLKASRMRSCSPTMVVSWAVPT